MIQLISSEQLTANMEVKEILQDSVLFNHFSLGIHYSYPLTLNRYTKSLIRNILLRDPAVEIEIRSITPNTKILCEHTESDCNCRRLMTIKNIIDAASDYESGINYLASFFHPEIHMDITEEGITHINIGPDSKTILGREVWSYLMAEFQVSENSPKISLMEMTGSLFYNKGLSTLPVVLENGEIVRHEAIIKNMCVSRLKEVNSDLINMLTENILPFSMYKNTSLTGNVRISVDVEDEWIPRMITEISSDFRSKESTKLAVILTSNDLGVSDIISGLDTNDESFDEIHFFIKDRSKLFILKSVQDSLGPEIKIMYQLLPTEITPSVFKGFSSVIKMSMEEGIVVITHRSQEPS